MTKPTLAELEALIAQGERELADLDRRAAALDEVHTALGNSLAELREKEARRIEADAEAAARKIAADAEAEARKVKEAAAAKARGIRTQKEH